MVMMPIQFFPLAPGANQPERRLMQAVLEDAVQCYRSLGRRTDRRSRMLFKETKDWLASDDISWPFSCVNVCHVLDIDVGRLRREVMGGPDELRTYAAVRASA